PSADATRDLGTAARRWRDIRAARDVIAGAALTAIGRITGSNGLRLTSGGFQRPDDAGLALHLGNGTNDHYAAAHNFRDAVGTGWADVGTGALRPGTTATFDLGLTGTRFRDGWLSRDLTVGGALAVTGASALAGGVTGRSGTRVPEIYVQADDPGAVGAGAIWIQT
ncbi:MAG: hypothetical protein ACK6AH_12090, partial [Gemmatimonadota bacterium]